MGLSTGREAIYRAVEPSAGPTRQQEVYRQILAATVRLCRVQSVPRATGTRNNPSDPLL